VYERFASKALSPHQNNTNNNDNTNDNSDSKADNQPEIADNNGVADAPVVQPAEVAAQ